MTTLSYLVEAVRGDAELPGDAGFRLELLSLEMSRLLDVIAQEIPGPAEETPASVTEVSLRSLAGQVTQLARDRARVRGASWARPGGARRWPARPCCGGY